MTFIVINKATHAILVYIDLNLCLYTEFNTQQVSSVVIIVYYYSHVLLPEKFYKIELGRTLCTTYSLFGCCIYRFELRHAVEKL